MTRRPDLLVIILLLVAFAAWVDLSQQIIISNPFNGNALVDKKSRSNWAWTCAAVCRCCWKPTCQPTPRSARLTCRPPSRS